MSKIYFRDISQNKFQLWADFDIMTPILPEDGQAIETDFCRLDPDGHLFVWKGYAWDGPMGPTKDVRKTIRASLPQDAFYQLFRLQLLPRDKKDAVDRFMKGMLIEDGMEEGVAEAWYLAIRLFGSWHFDPDIAGRSAVREAP